MNAPRRLKETGEIAAKSAVEVTTDATAVRSEIERLRGTPGRSEDELINTLQSEAGQGNWVMHGLWSLRNPAEMQTMADYYARTSPEVAAKNLQFVITKYVPPGAQCAWREIVDKISTDSI